MPYSRRFFYIAKFGEIDKSICVCFHFQSEEKKEVIFNMKIDAISLVHPSREVLNEEVLDIIQRESIGKFSGNLESALKLIGRLLTQSGVKKRYWLADWETPMLLTVDACKKSLAEAHLAITDIDALIYAGLYLEVLEPSSANMLAYELGARDSECFDLRAGCDGWMKAVKVSDALIKTGLYKKIMIVNAEFPMIRGVAIYPKLFALSSQKELAWRFPVFTLGEAVAVTIVGRSEDKWKYRFTSRNDLADLCTLTPPWYGQYPFSSSRIAPDGAGLFTSYGKELLREGVPEMISLFESFGIKPGEVDVLFTHSSSKRDWKNKAKTIGLGREHFDIYERCGNIVTASLPAAMYLALNEGRLRRGSRVLALNASAGMSFSACHFCF